MTEFAAGRENGHDGRIDADTALNARDVRALTECMSALNEGGDIYTVVGENDGTYRVDAREGRCACPDHKHRNATCKHQRRVGFATGKKQAPAGTDRIDDHLGEHTDGGPQLVVADGGIIDASADDGAEMLDDDGPEWVGPFTEYDKYGEPTGRMFVRCPECGVEVLESDTATAPHRPACRVD
jgi:hypothetical protein